MRVITMVGIVLIVIGVVALAYQGITYTTREKVLGWVRWKCARKPGRPSRYPRS
jgi:uncharacterized membrane protein HdeD (DUF308 family)